MRATLVKTDFSQIVTSFGGKPAFFCFQIFILILLIDSTARRSKAIKQKIVALKWIRFILSRTRGSESQEGIRKDKEVEGRGGEGEEEKEKEVGTTALIFAGISSLFSLFSHSRTPFWKSLNFSECGDKKIFISLERFKNVKQTKTLHNKNERVMQN